MGKKKGTLLARKKTFEADDQFFYCRRIALMEHLENQSRQYPEDEISTLSEVAWADSSYYFGRGSLIGPLVMSYENQIVRFREGDERFGIPAFVEQDAVQLLDCKARAVLVIDNEALYLALTLRRAWQKQKLILVSTCGVPQASTRRLVRRIQQAFDLPLYLLADSSAFGWAASTWGYFTFSLFKRGMLSPNMECPYLAVPDIKYLGLRVRDARLINNKRKRRKLPIKKRHRRQLQAMREYPCFQSPAWQKELRQFEKRGPADIVALWTSLKPKRFIREFIRDRINEGRWLE